MRTTYTSQLSLVAFTQSLKFGDVIRIPEMTCCDVSMMAGEDRWYVFEGFMLREDFENVTDFTMQFIETVIGGFLSLRGLKLDKVQSYDNTGRLIRFSRRGSERFYKDVARMNSLEYRVVKMKVPPKNK